MLEILRSRAVAAVLLGLLVGCRAGSSSGDLTAPHDAVPWENEHARAFDDNYSKAPVRLVGRAPHDVVDQQLFAQRLGHANVVALATVHQVWGKGRSPRRQDRFVEVELGDLLMGELPKGTRTRQTLRLQGDALPDELSEEPMLVFIRWAPADSPSYHHHLMPAEPDAVAFVRSMVQHAKDAGVLSTTGRQRAKRRPQPDAPAEEP